MVPPGMVDRLLRASRRLVRGRQTDVGGRPTELTVALPQAEDLAQLSRRFDRVMLRELYLRSGGEFDTMADWVFGDAGQAGTVRKRMLRLGLKVRDLEPLVAAR